MRREIVEAIQEFIKNKRDEKQIINTVIREDVFSVLERECHVLYYSMDDTIDGCHISKPLKGRMEQFVFINTKKVVQEQVWTAAHELGHVWNVDQHIQTDSPDSVEEREQIVGRFAAEFLMPEEVFRKEVRAKLKELSFSGKGLSSEMMIQLVTYLMNFFCTPYKSVVRRFVELKYVQKCDETEYLKRFENNFALYEKLIQENQYTRLEDQKDVYAIGNLQRDIELLEKQGVLRKRYVQRVRELFKINQSETIGNDLEFEAQQ